MLVLVFGEVIPKNLAAAHAESWAMLIAPFIRLVSIILTPVVFLLTKLSDMVVRFSKKDNEDVPTITEDEFRLLVDVGQEEGVFDESESEMINSIMEFDEIVVKEIMVPRIDIVGLDGDDNVNEALRLIIDGGHSRIPVYEDSIDNIIGILYAKDIFEHLHEDFDKLQVKTLMRDAYYIPETKKVDDLLEELRMKKVHMAIILDEYGGTSGLVTIEDLLEEIIGDIQDEYDEEEEEISKIDENTFTVEGTIDIEEIDELIGKELPEGDYETLAGFIMDELQCIPKNGEMNEVVFENVKFTVLEVEDRRIEKIKVEITPVVEEDDEEDDDD